MPEPTALVAVLYVYGSVTVIITVISALLWCEENKRRDPQREELRMYARAFFAAPIWPIAGTALLAVVTARAIRGMWHDAFGKEDD